VAHSTPGATAAKRATETIPIVMIAVGDPVGIGLIANLARPGGNFTGSSYSAFGLEIIGKQLELFKEAVPKIRRVAVLSNGANPIQPLAIREANVAARSLGVQLQVLDVRGPSEFDRAFGKMAQDRVGRIPCSFSSEHNSQTAPRRPACRQSMVGESMRRSGASCPMGRT